MHGEQAPSQHAGGNTPSYAKRMEQYYEKRVAGAWNGRHILQGRVPDQTSVLLMSNDYLSLSNHPRILRSQADALLAQGRSAIITSELHQRQDGPRQRLLGRLAEWLHSEAVVLCQSGWCANIGLLQCIADPDTPVYIDAAAHESLWEGARHSGASPRAFAHNALDELEDLIVSSGPGVVAVDAVYSTCGDLCPLPQLVELCEHYGCVLVLDESHSLGVFGAQGKGLAAELGLAERVHFRTASLGKAFAARAGLVTCSARFAEYFRASSGPAIFSSALLAHEIVRLTATLAVIREEGWRRERLGRNAATLRAGLRAAGYDLGGCSSHIIPLYAGTELQAMELRDALEARGIFGAIFFPPATPPDGALVRLSVNASITQEQIRRVIDACRDLAAQGNALGLAAN